MYLAKLAMQLAVQNEESELFVCPANGDISVSQQPKDSNNNNNSKNKQYNKKVRNRKRLIYIIYT